MQTVQRQELHLKSSAMQIFDKASQPSILAQMRFESVFFFIAPLTGFLLLAIVIIYGLFTGNAFFRFYQLELFGSLFQFSFYSIVIFFWFFILDGTHLFHSLARIFLLPRLFKIHRKSLIFSFMFFVLGPVAVLFPYLAQSAWQIDEHSGLAFVFDLFPTVLLCCYFIWAYFHVTQQHWGFASMKSKHLQKSTWVAQNLKRDSTDHQLKNDNFIRILRRYYLFCTIIAPITFFLLDGHLPLTATSRFAISSKLEYFGISKTHVVGMAFALFLVATLITLFSFKHQRTSFCKSGFSLICSTSLLHLCVMSLPPLALFVHPIITVGHDLQYHFLCLLDGKTRASQAAELFPHNHTNIRWNQKIFNGLYSNVLFIALTCFLFAVLSTSPFFWVESLEDLLRYLPFPLPQSSTEKVYFVGNYFITEAPLAQRLISAFCIGFAAQHYYIDGKIWKLSQDPDLIWQLNRALFPKS